MRAMRSGSLTGLTSWNTFPKKVVNALHPHSRTAQHRCQSCHKRGASNEKKTCTAAWIATARRKTVTELTSSAHPGNLNLGHGTSWW
jgi:hypothetical protein